MTGPVQVQPNHVYVIPPNNQLMFEEGTLHLIEPQQARGRRVTIDLFFRTLAQAYGQRAVCVILSGSDSDGAIGLKHVRAQGGVTIAQDPNEAEYDSMPVTAISTGMVDWVLPVGQMPARLIEFVQNERRMKLPPEIEDAEEPQLKEEEAPGGETISEETHDPDDEEAIGKVLADLRGQTGHDFSHYKRATVLRRIARRLQVNSLESIPQYLDFLRQHPAEARALLQDLLIGVTHFFRDREAFAALEAHIPQLFAGKKPDDHLRVWVAGCATGEEAYSIAILLCEHAERARSSAAHPGLRFRCGRTGDRRRARRSLPEHDRGGRLAGAVARVFRFGSRALPGAERDSRKSALRGAQRPARRALFAPRHGFVPQPAHLPERRRPASALRHFPFHTRLGRAALHWRSGK